MLNPSNMIAPQTPDLEFLTCAWVQAKPRRARLRSLVAWWDYAVAGLREKPDGRLTACSKKLSYILRHGTKHERVPMNKDGAACADDLLRHPKFKNFDMDDIEIIVLANAKQRFGMYLEGGKTMLYCRQGQSDKLGLDPLRVRGMKLLAPGDMPIFAIHGTFIQKLASIRREGLKAMGRPIHFAISGTRSGVRDGTDVHLYVMVHQAAVDGIKFFLSENGVLLTNGWDSILPSAYIVGGASSAGNLLFGEIPTQTALQTGLPALPNLNAEHFRMDTDVEDVKMSPAPADPTANSSQKEAQWPSMDPRDVAADRHKTLKRQARRKSEIVTGTQISHCGEVVSASFPLLVLAAQPRVRAISPKAYGCPCTQECPDCQPSWLGWYCSTCETHIGHSRQNLYRPLQSRDAELAIKVVKVLRHQACDKQLSLDGEGFVSLQDLLKLRRFKDASEQDIWSLATENSARFDVKVARGSRMLRATYKHSGTMAN